MSIIGTTTDQLDFASLRADIGALYDSGIEALLMQLGQVSPGQTALSPIGPFSLVSFKLWRPLFIVVEYGSAPDDRSMAEAVACGADALALYEAEPAAVSAATERFPGVLVASAWNADWNQMNWSSNGHGSEWCLLHMTGSPPHESLGGDVALLVWCERLSGTRFSAARPAAAFFSPRQAVGTTIETALQSLGSEGRRIAKRLPPDCFNGRIVSQLYSDLGATLPIDFPTPDY